MLSGIFSDSVSVPTSFSSLTVVLSYVSVSDNGESEDTSLAGAAESLMFIELYAGVISILSPSAEIISVAVVSMLAVPLARVLNLNVAVIELPLSPLLL